MTIFLLCGTIFLLFRFREGGIPLFQTDVDDFVTDDHDDDEGESEERKDAVIVSERTGGQGEEGRDGEVSQIGDRHLEPHRPL